MTAVRTKNENARLALQAGLDAQKSQAERNALGQFATPTLLATDILQYVSKLISAHETVSFLDPAIGTGSFYSALRRVFPSTRVREAVGYEIDPHYAIPAQNLWRRSDLALHLADFTAEKPVPKFNLVICNPPYVRHHHLSAAVKKHLQATARDVTGINLGGLSGLYCYFMALTHAWMSDNAIAVWLVPSEFMDVNYGQELKRYLLERVTLLHIHRFDPNDVQFLDALVSSAVVCFKHARPKRNHRVTFSFGRSMNDPTVVSEIPTAALASEAKWTRFPLSEVRSKSDAPRLGEYFKIQRGIATGDNSYFILSENEIVERDLPFEAFRPILPSPRYVAMNEIKADPFGKPLLDRRLYLLDPQIPEEAIEQRFPALWSYLEEGRERNLHERYLCRHRTPWYSQEKRPPAPIVCTYLGRADTKTGRPFRFILNHSKATVANVYLAMYPAPTLARAIAQDRTLLRKAWEILSALSPEALLQEGRVYGGGLHKLEPRELRNVPVPDLTRLFPDLDREPIQTEIF